MRTKKTGSGLYTLILIALLTLTSCARHYEMEEEPQEISMPEPVVEKAPVQPVVKPKPFIRKTIVIDSGHGGKDCGTSSGQFKYQEKKLTLQTANLIRSYLEKKGYNVIMTRHRDEFVSLEKRVSIANQASSHLFVSMHYNYADNTKAQGIEVHYFDAKQHPQKAIASKKLAQTILGEVIHFTGAKSRGIKNSNLVVIRKTDMAAVLVEGGFLSNPQERQKLKDHRYLEALAWGVACGIDNYLKAL
ncbi:MAG: N-acetylmuramoyl-L-alanine amidase [Parachlamydiales bacterium]|nr:N-acetylmuramoyl-L-alanine amidase [Parachlamydiales bacterium]